MVYEWFMQGLCRVNIGVSVLVVYDRAPSYDDLLRSTTIYYDLLRSHRIFLHRIFLLFSLDSSSFEW